MDRMLGGKSLDNVEIFNLGTGNGVSVLELINTFEAATGVKVPHKIVGRREGDIEKVWANPERANKVLGWKATETLADTLASAWKWQRKDCANAVSCNRNISRYHTKKGGQSSLLNPSAPLFH